eukprot:6241788-Amphidinium_carterae.1
MATRTLGKRKQILNNEKYHDGDACVLEGSFGLWRTCRPRGQNVIRRTTQTFDMEAELAIELARICVTRA